MFEDIKPGLTHTERLTVTEALTARAWGSGNANVLATPSMIAVMETAAMNCVAPLLPEGKSTVGTRVCISHDSATPVGMEFYATAVLRGAEGRRLTFDVEAFDECGKIGGGTHERFIIDSEKFQAKTDAKRAL